MSVHGVLVTYRRPHLVRRLLERLVCQDRELDSLVMVDNDPDPENEAALREYARHGTRTVYLPAVENLGPAGGIELGMRRVLEDAGDDDWIVLIDDDNHELAPSELADLLSFASECLVKDPRTAGVGERGANFSWSRVRARVGAVDSEVDYLAGNGFPMYRVAAVRDVGVFAGELFFGFEELDYCLRLRAAGYALYKAGRAQRLPPAKRRPKLVIVATTELNWRRYYVTAFAISF